MEDISKSGAFITPGYNIANLQQNGVADKLTHLVYAFANVTATPAPACSIADPWADYQSPYLPSVSGVSYPGPMYGDFAASPSLVLLANGTALCPDLSGNTAGCDTLLTPGLATYSTLSTLTSNGYSNYFDPRRIAVSLYDPTGGTFYTYDDPTTAFLKMLYVDLKIPGGLGGAYVWALKDDDANGTMVKTMAAGLGRSEE